MNARLAATIMILRNHLKQGIEVFMVRRVVQSEFMPDIYVFPGGSVANDDREIEETTVSYTPLAFVHEDHSLRTALGTGVRTAAIRELFEEGNILLAYYNKMMLSIEQSNADRFTAYRNALNERRASLSEILKKERLTLATDQLGYFARWITPDIPELPRRFDTHFFLAAAPAEQEAIFDQLETSEGIWIEPATALKRFTEGTFPIAFPTFHQLQDLTRYLTVDEALRDTQQRPVATHLPIFTRIDGVAYVYLTEHPQFKWRL